MSPGITAALARTFLDAAGAPPCLAEETVVRGLAAVFAEQRRLAAFPSTPNEILIRRISHVTAKVCRDFGLTEEQLRDVLDLGPHARAARDAWASALGKAGLSSRQVARETGMSRAWVRKAAARYLRHGAARAPASMQTRTVSR